MSEFEERKQEIKTLIQSSNLDRATKRLIDLAKDYSEKSETNDQTIIIRSNFVSIRKEENQFGRSSETSKERNLLMKQMLSLLTEISTEVQNTSTDSPTETKASTRPVEHSIKPTNRKIDRDIILQGKGLSKSYDHFTLDPIDIILRAGEITGLVGKNGSGKSTLLSMLARGIKPGEGTLTYPKLDSDDWNEIECYFCYIPQEIWLYRYNVSVKNELHYWFSTHGIKGRQNKALVKEVLYRLDLTEYSNINPDKLSGGYKLRFELAKVFGLRPELIILDEPLANLDVNAQITFLEDIRNLADSSKYRSAIIISSQHLEEVESISDQIIFLNEGKTLFNGAIADLGADRKNNTLELEADTNIEELMDLLSEFNPDINIERRGTHYILSTPLEVTAEDLIKYLFSKKISIHYFRDISRSTKNIFEQLIIK